MPQQRFRHLEIPVGGIQKHSLIDYPGHISTVIFTCGCNFRCGYCHNPDLVYPFKIKALKKYAITSIIDWLIVNVNMLDAVVITGGEPTIHPSLPGLIKEIKNTGLKIKLDTNGSNPKMLSNIIHNGLVDYVAMDIKASLNYDAYKKVVGYTVPEDVFLKVKESVCILNESVIPKEYRTTLDDSVSISDIKSLIPQLQGRYYLQKLSTDTVSVHKNAVLQELNVEELNDLNSGLEVFLR
ncbi:MAG: anaerobic ribonucleoside-triphosphate reductase activating protein [Bacteroidales bacterium]|nr:anaerobic ribonucleoside-triphosphate reductase activating protein [Bacteroidales bacterium]